MIAALDDDVWLVEYTAKSNFCCAAGGFDHFLYAVGDVSQDVAMATSSTPLCLPILLAFAPHFALHPHFPLTFSLPFFTVAMGHFFLFVRSVEKKKSFYSTVKVGNAQENNVIDKQKQNHLDKRASTCDPGSRWPPKVHSRRGDASQSVGVSKLSFQMMAGQS